MNESDKKSGEKDISDTVTVGAIQEAGASFGGVISSVIIGFFASKKINNGGSSGVFFKLGKSEYFFVCFCIFLFAVFCVIGEILDENFMNYVFNYTTSKFSFINDRSPSISSVSYAKFMTNTYRESIIFTIDVVSFFLSIVIIFDIFRAVGGRWKIHADLYKSNLIVDVFFFFIIVYFMYFDADFAQNGRILSNKYFSIFNICVFESGIYYCVHSAINRIVRIFGN